jgi:hypothetical protein
MKRPFSESRHIVSGLCESLKTSAIYKNWILEEIKAQLGNNPFRRHGVPSIDLHDAAAEAGEEDGDDVLIQSREQQDRGRQSR